jgi:hypothetical protein
MSHEHPEHEHTHEHSEPVSLVNLGGQRLGITPDTEEMRDLEQARLAIEGVRALLPILEELDAEQMRPVRDALSQLQMAYAQLARGEGGGPGGPPPGGEPPPGPAPEPQEPPTRDPQRGGLWVPPGTLT